MLVSGYDVCKLILFDALVFRPIIHYTTHLYAIPQGVHSYWSPLVAIFWIYYSILKQLHLVIVYLYYMYMCIMYTFLITVFFYRCSKYESFAINFSLVMMILGALVAAMWVTEISYSIHNTCTYMLQYTVYRVYFSCLTCPKFKTAKHN